MNWHARSGDSDGNSFEVIFHITLPSANNRVGVNYRTAVVKSGIGGKTSMTTGATSGEITAAEKAQIDAGELFEVSERIDTYPGETAGQLRTRIDARYTVLVATLPGRLQRMLTYWGYDSNV